MLKGFLAKREYRKTVKSVVMVQAATRRHLCRKEFLNWRREQKRPYTIRFLGAEGVSGLHPGEHVRLIFTVMDGLQRKQLCRVDGWVPTSPRSSTSVSPSPVKILVCRDARSTTVTCSGRNQTKGGVNIWFDEEVLIPGTASSVTFVMTLIRIDAQADTFIGQSYVSIRNSDFLITKSDENFLDLKLTNLLVSHEYAHSCLLF